MKRHGDEASRVLQSKQQEVEELKLREDAMLENKFQREQELHHLEEALGEAQAARLVAEL